MQLGIGSCLVSFVVISRVSAMPPQEPIAAVSLDRGYRIQGSSRMFPDDKDLDKIPDFSKERHNFPLRLHTDLPTLLNACLSMSRVEI